jgi:signal transduction histidine kinase
VLRVHGLINRHISFPSQDHNSSISMDVMMTDSESNVWIGNETEGIFRIQKQSITTYSASQGLEGRDVYLVLGALDGNLWIGTWPQSLTRIRDGKVTTFGARDNVPAYLSALAEDRQGDIWIGSPEGIRVLHEGRIMIPKNIPDLKIPAIQAIYQSDAGALLLGTAQGVYVINGSSVSVMKSRDGLASDDARVIIKDHNGDIWMGGYGGVTQLSSHLTPKARWTEQNGLPSGNVRSIYEDSAHNIWIGTYDGGLGLLRNGKWTTFNVAQGLYDNGVFQILEDRYQNFWMSSNRGIYRTSKVDLYAFADGKKTRIQSVGYGKADGMLNIECNGGFWPSGAIDRRGFLWFPTQDGVAVINPDILEVPKQGPRTVIESVSIDHTEVGSVPRVVLKPDQQDLEIRYTALSFSKPEQIEFRYKLENIDREWEYAGRRRTAYYKHLPPGRYVFHVTSVNSDGVWSKEDQRLAIEVVPHFFQQWWFIASLVLALFAAASAFWNHRIRQLQRTKAAQKAFSQQLLASQEAERRRIAAELHDGLSQHLVVIKNLAIFLLKPKGERASEGEKRLNLEEISSEASAAMDEARSMLHALRPFQLERVGLSRAIQGLVKTAERASGIQFTLDLDDIDGAFPQELQINFFRIAQEAVNNIIKHSNATTASIAAKFDHGTLYLSISDNGKGLDTNTQRMTPGSGGFGLTGIQERVDLLNGSLRISSHFGSGTLLSMIFLTRPTDRK